MLRQEIAVERADKQLLTKGLIAGGIIGLATGLIIALFVIIRLH